MAGIREVYHLGATVEGEAEDYSAPPSPATRNIIEACLKHAASKSSFT